MAKRICTDKQKSQFSNKNGIRKVLVTVNLVAAAGNEALSMHWAEIFYALRYWIPTSLAHSVNYKKCKVRFIGNNPSKHRRRNGGGDTMPPWNWRQGTNSKVPPMRYCLFHFFYIWRRTHKRPYFRSASIVSMNQRSNLPLNTTWSRRFIGRRRLAIAVFLKRQLLDQGTC